MRARESDIQDVADHPQADQSRPAIVVSNESHELFPFRNHPFMAGMYGALAVHLSTTTFALFAGIDVKGLEWPRIKTAASGFVVAFVIRAYFSWCNRRSLCVAIPAIEDNKAQTRKLTEDVVRLTAEAERLSGKGHSLLLTRARRTGDDTELAELRDELFRRVAFYREERSFERRSSLVVIGAAILVLFLGWAAFILSFS